MNVGTDIDLHSSPVNGAAKAGRGALGAGNVPGSEAISRMTFGQAARSMWLDGVSTGFFSLNAYVALVAMGGDAAGYGEELSTLVTMLPSVAMLFATLYNAGGTARKRRRYFLFAGGFGKGIYVLIPLLVLLPGIAPPFAFVSLVGLSAIAFAGVPPALNQIWGANYSAASRGKMFALLSMFSMFAVMVSSFVAGRFLDSAPMFDGVANYQLLYPFGAIIGAGAMLGYYRIRLRYAAAVQAGERRGAGAVARFGRSIMRAVHLLKEDRNFRTYEIGFFLYGLAFMMLLPVIPVLFKNFLNADYQDFAGATVVTTQLMLMLMAPVVAWLARGRRVTQVTGVAFSVLLLYPLVLTLTAATKSLYLAYASFVVFGVAMSGVHFVWNLGPVTFARGGNALPHTSTHATLVGARALIGFPLSYALMKAFPGQLVPVFAVAAALLVLGVITMWRLDRRMKSQGLSQTT